MQIMENLPQIIGFITSNWETFAIIGLTLNSLIDVLRKKQYSLIWPIAIKLVREVSAQQLSGKEKRQAVVDILMGSSPRLVKRVISRDEMEIIVEEAYLFLRGELKENKLESTDK
jgi:hypothetical protein